jgi:hypothetical protein
MATAIGIFSELRDRFDETSTLLNLGDAHLDAGDRAGARDAWREALTILEELEHPNTATAHASRQPSPRA